MKKIRNWILILIFALTMVPLYAKADTTSNETQIYNKDLTRLFQHLSDWDVELHGGVS